MSTQTNASGPPDPTRKNLQLIKNRSYDIRFELEGTDYSPVDKIGSGAYGVVCSAINRKTKVMVAVKKIPNIFENIQLATRTYREIKILRHFQHENIISIREILRPVNRELRDVYIVLDLMESDLHRIIHTNPLLSNEHVCYFLYQILRGLKYIHSANVIHRDLKPSNLLVKSNCDLKIGDFGMARGFSSCLYEQTDISMTQYVATRWYRAPELILSMPEYTAAVDVWSVGCIFAEMLGRKQLFPGSGQLNQLSLIVKTLGTPSKKLLDKCRDALFFRNSIEGMDKTGPIPFQTLYPHADPKALDLLQKMLAMDPDERVTVETALKHPYLKTYHNPEDEPACIPAFDFDFEKTKMSRDALKAAILKEINDTEKPASAGPPYNIRLIPKEELERGKASQKPAADVTKKETASTRETQGAGSRITTGGGVYNVRFIPKEELDKKPPNGSRDRAAVTKAVLKQLQERARQRRAEMAKAEPETTDRRGEGANANKVRFVPKEELDNKMAWRKAREDAEETLQPTAPGEKGGDDDDEKKLSTIPPTGDLLGPTDAAAAGEGALKVDADKFTDDVEMLSAKTGELRISPPEDATQGVQLSVTATTADVDMPSAKREESVGTAAPGADDKAAEPAKPPDTKALIKAAILNGRKARSMSESGEPPRPRITALQRQRQREDKRKKKIERANQRKKKHDTKPELVLSDADRSLLERWKNMQQTTKPFVHPIRSHMKDLLSQEQKDTRPSVNQNQQVGGVTSLIGSVNHITTVEVPATVAGAQLNQTGGRALVIGSQVQGIPTTAVRTMPTVAMLGQPNTGVISTLIGNVNQPTGSAQMTSRNNVPFGGGAVFSQPVNSVPQDPSVNVIQIGGGVTSNVVGVPTQHVGAANTLTADLQQEFAGMPNPVGGVSGSLGVVPPGGGAIHPLVGAATQQVGGATEGRLQSLMTSDSTQTIAAGTQADPGEWRLKFSPLDQRVPLEEDPILSLVDGPPLSTEVLPFSDNPESTLTTAQTAEVDLLPPGWVRQPTEGVQSNPSLVDYGHLSSYSEAYHSKATAFSSQPPVTNITSPTDLIAGAPDSRTPDVNDAASKLSMCALHMDVWTTINNRDPTPSTSGTAKVPPPLQVPSHRGADDLTLEQTPKGTGGGYGVGLDLDALFETLPMDADQESNRASEKDPLSPSLLNYWQEISNMNSVELEALERELAMGFPSPTLANVTAES